MKSTLHLLTTGMLSEASKRPRIENRYLVAHKRQLKTMRNLISPSQINMLNCSQSQVAQMAEEILVHCSFPRLGLPVLANAGATKNPS